MKYVLGIDQSTQGTKALIFDENAVIIAKEILSHKQIITENGYIEHNPDEIYNNVIEVVKLAVKSAEISPSELVSIGITNQRETVVCFQKDGTAIHNAIVWQCSRGAEICSNVKAQDKAFENYVKSNTGLELSPYFSASKIAWVLQNCDNISDDDFLCGTIDTYLIYKLTNGKSFKTDFSNAARTMLFNINTLAWDEKICDAFGVSEKSLPEVCASNSCFGYTNLGGILENEIPINAVLGDSNAALFGQGCIEKGQIKSTYGTGSSVMMNIGEKPIYADSGVVCSIAWNIDGKTDYVIEGNINYTGAVISWLKDKLQLISSPQEVDACSENANPADTTYLVPAFTGLSAPYWDNNAKASISGMTRITGKNEICKAANESIAYQINDILELIKSVSKINITELCVDGGPTKSRYLMQFQADISDVKISILKEKELSAIGVAILAGMSAGIYSKDTVSKNYVRNYFLPEMKKNVRKNKINGWKKSVKLSLSK